ncbi:unnamed protein product [Lactuca saligna]|uniref:Uncharacterized protein n=1 Tax=Lactuca saligna TaxID=75948 RepID=A0AA36EGJ9_LACSI|nr:unnamed protein product [Lactuca saligna]
MGMSNLLPNFDRQILLDLFKNKANTFNSSISLSFPHPEHRYVMNYIDEADVLQLKNVMSETKDIVHLYLEVFKGRVEEIALFDNIVTYNGHNIVSDNVEHGSGEEIVELNEVEEQNLDDFGKLGEKTLSDDEKSYE